MTAAARKQTTVDAEPPRLAAVPAEFDSTEFRRLAREALSTAVQPDPAVSAVALVDGMTDAQCRVALLVTLPGWLRQVGGNMDRATRHEVAPAAEPRTTPTTAQRVNSWYQRVLATRIMAGEQWKFLGECTAGDVLAAAEVRFKAAAATQAEGDRLRALADHMTATGAKTVAKVKPEALQHIYGAAA